MGTQTTVGAQAVLSDTCKDRVQSSMTTRFSTIDLKSGHSIAYASGSTLPAASAMSDYINKPALHTQCFSTLSLMRVAEAQLQLQLEHHPNFSQTHPHTRTLSAASAKYGSRLPLPWLWKEQHLA